MKHETIEKGNKLLVEKHLFESVIKQLEGTLKNMLYVKNGQLRFERKDGEEHANYYLNHDTCHYIINYLINDYRDKRDLLTSEIEKLKWE